MSVVDLKKTIDALPLSPVAYLLVIYFLFSSGRSATIKCNSRSVLGPI
jgi:hypothetical protein